MSLIIGKLGFGKDDFYYGLELCLSRAGLKAYAVTPMTSQGCDVILITMFWYRDVYWLEKFLRESGLKKGSLNGPILIAGGIHCTMAPRLVAEMVDYVFLGDADDCLGEIIGQIERGEKPHHQNLFESGMENVPSPRACPPSAFAMQEGGASGVVRVEVARGCRYKCSFCAISKLKAYREVDADQIIKIIKDTPEKTVSLFAPERTMHSRWHDLSKALADCGKHDLGQDVRLEHLMELPGNIATVGIEGISYRLRRSIKKSFKHEFIIEKMKEFVESRKRVCMLSAYFIADLPGEDDSDLDELYSLFESIEQENFSRFLVFKPVLNPLSPKPFTDLMNVEIHPFRDYRSKWQNILRKRGGQWGFRCIESMVWGPFERTMDSLATWGGERAYEIIRRMSPALLRFDIHGGDRDQAARSIIAEAALKGINEQHLFGPRIVK